MPKFRKKPVIVQAHQYRVPGESVPGLYFKQPHGQPYCVTIHGQETDVALGDWLIQEPDGTHYYPCKDAVFQRTYEPMDEP